MLNLLLAGIHFCRTAVLSCFVCPQACCVFATAASSEPRFASGGAFELLRSLADMHTAQCQVSLPSDLTSAQQAKAITEFELGRNHIVSVLVLKNMHWTQPPLLACAMSHPDRSVAEKAFKECQASSCQHVRIKALQCEPLRSQALRYFSDPAVDDSCVKDFIFYLAEHRFMWTAERAVEGEHAIFHKRGRAAPSHSVRYLSFSRRVAEFKRDLEQDETVVLKIGSFLDRYPASLTMIKRLGLAGHPAVQRSSGLAHRSRRSQITDAPFLADDFSICEMPAPEVDVIENVIGNRVEKIQENVSMNTDDLLQKYAAEFLSQSLVKNCGKVFSMEARDGCIHRLAELLTAGNAKVDDKEFDINEFLPDATQLPEVLHKTIFFTPVAGPSMYHRTKVAEEAGFLNTDVSIIVLDVLKLVRQNRQVWVSLAPANQWDDALLGQSLVLNPQALPLEVVS